MTLKTVYLLDDEPEFLTLLTEVIEQVGLAVKRYSKAIDLFENVSLFETDAILVLDLHLPEIDGIEVMRYLASIKNPPAIILTSGHDIGILHAAEKLGHAQQLEILATLDKPISLDEFRLVLLQYLQRNICSQNNTRNAKVDAFSVVDFQQALDNNQLILCYQPQVDIKTGQCIGVEALVRWQHPKFGLIFPFQFIPYVEKTGQMAKLTNWVIEHFIQQETQWIAEGYPISVSINISADDITRLNLPEQLTELLTKHRIDPMRLTLEVTESTLMGELITSLDILTRLRLKGIGLSIDDFGTGYSSLSQLHKIPFTELKIDGSFVAEMAQDADAKAIVKTCILLGHELNMRVVAEGIENQQTWDLLTDLDCDIAQGFYIAKPMCGNQLIDWVKHYHPAPDTYEIASPL